MFYILYCPFTMQVSQKNLLEQNTLRNVYYDYSMKVLTTFIQSQTSEKTLQSQKLTGGQFQKLTLMFALNFGLFLEVF